MSGVPCQLLVAPVAGVGETNSVQGTAFNKSETPLYSPVAILVLKTRSAHPSALSNQPSRRHLYVAEFAKLNMWMVVAVIGACKGQFIGARPRDHA